MGKRLIIKGADFSANGMKVIDYVNYIFSTKKYNGVSVSDGFINIVGSGAPISSFDSLNGKITIEAYMQGVSTEYSVIAGAIESGAIRLSIGKSYEADSNKSPFKISAQYGIGAYSDSAMMIDDGKHTITIDGKNVYVDGVDLAVGGSISASNYLFTQIALLGTYNSATLPQCKYSRIKFDSSDGTTIADYRAAKDEQGVACLYESVSKTYIYGESVVAE